MSDIVDYMKYKHKKESNEIDREIKRVQKILKSGKPTLPDDDVIWDSIQPPHNLNYYIPKNLIYILYGISMSTMSKEMKVNKMREVLYPRGILLIGVGTNRAAFQSIETPNIVFKVAIDHVGRKDSPRELINQEYLKPFCTKIFEVSPCGTVGMVEGVFPIKSKADFSLFFDMIVQGFLLPIVLGRYAIDDIGFENFMNYGVRQGFGPVLLDFPYLYLYDMDKMICHNKMEDGSRCKGKIDYEVGFMDFVCPKCGARFKAADIGKPIYDVSSILNTHFKETTADNNGVIPATKKHIGLHKVNDIGIKITEGDKVIMDTTKDKKKDIDKIRTVSFQEK